MWFRSLNCLFKISGLPVIESNEDLAGIITKTDEDHLQALKK